MPHLDLSDQISNKNTLQFRVGVALLLEEAYLLCCGDTGCHIKLLIANAVTGE